MYSKSQAEVTGTGECQMLLTKISTMTCMPTLIWWRIQYQSLRFIGTHLKVSIDIYNLEVKTRMLSDRENL